MWGQLQIWEAYCNRGLGDTIVLEVLVFRWCWSVTAPLSSCGDEVIRTDGRNVRPFSRTGTTGGGDDDDGDGDGVVV